MSMLISTTPPPAQRFILADSSGSSSRKRFLSLQNHLRSPTVTPLSSSFTTFNPLRLSIKSNEMMMKYPLDFHSLFCCVDAGKRHCCPEVLSRSLYLLSKHRRTSFHGSRVNMAFGLRFLPFSSASFFFIPGELELPFMALLLVIVAPYQAMNIGGRQEGAIVGLAIAAYLAFQHFSRIGNLQKAFEQGSIVATLAVVCVVVISCLLLI
ncbi:hypothetical protein OIU84_024758 [Salix udensis]|uniref:Uncharacterized protein n=1 Tax=Salix udensis TaxID=889485 RepID=A0AAD6KI52_9ROSI|nr:hypothetical protein OIU84_024758 [Salix udensis]